MGKYMRKSKASGEVAVMEVAGALLGVRTRSRTLAAQQQRAPSPSPQRKGHEDGDYLELRSRRLEKQPPPGPKDKEDAPQPPAAGGRRMEQAPSSFAAEGFEADLEVSFGDNVLDWDATDRGARETTPCSLIYSSETMSTPGSATGGARNHSRRRAQTPVCRYVPSSLEMDEFFAAAEQQQHQTFRDKYNFCPASGCPLPGRYEWTVLDC
ncbi:hypothetical protein CFC21_068881 [Triticum aestivum]|uniref:Cyclin-dependent kinase inhibitor n=4 Tax=Triticum TaxID=4564 RepID=A0A9R0U5I4_TRITD|nr:cyclin-dependent kinase inhibitor 5-like [Triticum dicoccoides]XP_044383975.1 cyclin-dependent kinase inhibitor 5-like [Triticum aestivum]KAF7062257.1 hypothetical protein CFC21_068881 [Triticum aestivum]VAI24906.1 unnamed protein product [Triticum turgidum subsp. durum]